MISIAMATYNGEKYLREQMDSILRQTHQEFEVVVCDDASTDATWQILQEYERQDARIHCYWNEKNLGYLKNFEKAIRLCKGDYIALSDQDDIWTEDHLEVLFTTIGNNQLCCGNWLLINEDGKNLTKTCDDNLGDGATSDDVCVKKVLYGRNLYQGASMLLGKSFMSSALPIPNGVVTHDVWFALLSNVMHSFVYTHKIITHYRQHGNNASGSKIVELSIVDRVMALLRSIPKSKVKGERYYHCQALLERLPNMDVEMKQLILEAKDFFENKQYFIYRVRHIGFWISHYDLLYGYGINRTNSKIWFLLRLIKYIFYPEKQI
ncbi:hypothetical protein AGMMS4956_00630 [Bacteroidia bacterium]|nr:hypothetical protein AGMMS4956_00630 [Bacteroidia bacterium]